MRVLALAIVLLAAGCASQRTLDERDALATFNRCTVAVKEMNQPMYQLCLSSRLKQQHASKAAQDGQASGAALEGYRDSRPYATQVRGLTLSEDGQTATLDTLNYTRLLDQSVEHSERIVLVRENGRWVIDKECCDYAASRFVEENAGVGGTQGGAQGSERQP